MGQVSFIRKQVLPGPQHQQIEIGDGVDSNEGDHIERDQCKIDQVLPDIVGEIAVYCRAWPSVYGKLYIEAPNDGYQDEP